MNRTDFYQKVRVIQEDDQIDELDFLVNPLSEFPTKYPVKYYRVRGHDEKRPDNIAHRVYGDWRLWWVILVANGIDLPYTDIEPGSILTIPNILDVYEFQKEFRVRRTR